MNETRIGRRLTRTAALVATVLGLTAIAVPASADLTLSSDQVVAVRQAVMRTNAAFNGLVAAQAKGALTIPADQQKAIGEAWLRFGKLAPALFPAGSGMANVKESKAKPEIWTNAADFKTKLEAYTKATSDFQAAAAKGDAGAVKTATEEVGKACQNCHETYRAR